MGRRSGIVCDERQWQRDEKAGPAGRARCMRVRAKLLPPETEIPAGQGLKTTTTTTTLNPSSLLILGIATQRRHM